MFSVGKKQYAIIHSGNGTNFRAAIDSYKSRNFLAVLGGYDG